MKRSSDLALPIAAIMGTGHYVDEVFGPLRVARIASQTHLVPGILTPEQWRQAAARLETVEVIFGTWTMPAFTDEDVALLPKLKAVFYAAGDTRYFAAPLLKRGVEVFCAVSANAIPVAEFTLAQILLANKGYFANTRQFREPLAYETAYRGRGNHGATVALLGAGEIGRALIARLKPFSLRVVVFDPFLDEVAATKLGVEKVTLEEAFSQGDVVSNHLADLPATKGMLRGIHFAAMPKRATFINTGRGATVCEPELIEVLRERPDLNALLDVTEPEPPIAGSLFYELPNVQLSAHIAGSLGDERGRMADLMLEKFIEWQELCAFP